MENFEKYSRYYDLLYLDKNYLKESQYVVDLVNEYSINSKDLLDLGCGSGGHATFLSKSGFSITGVEKSRALIDIAINKKINNFRIVEGDIIDFKINKKFDVALSLFHVISYITTTNDILKCFKNVYDHLKPGGIFIFDVWNTPGVYSEMPTVKIKKMADSEIEVTRIATPEVLPNDNIVNVVFELFIKEKRSGLISNNVEIHPMRHFSISEIDFFANSCGLKLMHFEEYLTKAIPEINTWGVCYVLKRI